MRPFFATLFFLAFTLSCSEPPPAQQAAPAQPATQEPAVEAATVEGASRLVVGDQAPNFHLFDQEGTDRTLESLLAEGKVALVFHRSADW